MPSLRKGMLLQRKYERAILEGAKTWEGRAARGLAAQVCVGDTVEFRITGLRNAGTLRRLLLFRVAEVRRFASCKSMLQALGVSSLLPDMNGALSDACQSYEGLVGTGQL